MVEETVSTSQPESGFNIASRWVSLTKDILAAAKDLGILAFVVLIVLFREPAFDFLNKHRINLTSVNLFGIQFGLDSLQIAGEAQQLGSLVSKEPGQPDSVKKAMGDIEHSAQKIQEIEAKVLTSPEASLIGDWAIVVAGQPTLEKAKSSRDGMSFGEGARPQIFKKREYFRIVVQSGNKDVVERTLVAVRRTFPDAYLVSLARWCGQISSQAEYLSCSAN
ncbi:MAG: hypothetical protein IPJ50_19600 [Betaproteobacteria bacterium]|jgi:hypothetical protein|nr:hypothetical protein [Betaproteobacteria bacterium]